MRPKPHLNSTLLVTDVTPQHLSLQILEPHQPWGPIYKLQYQQTPTNVQQIQTFFRGYSKCELRLTSTNIHIALQILSPIGFSQVEFSGELGTNEMEVLGQFETTRFCLKSELSVEELRRVEGVLKRKCAKRGGSMELQFYVKQGNSEQLIDFFSEWVSGQKEQEKYTRIELNAKGKRLMSLESKPNYGIFICLGLSFADSSLLLLNCLRDYKRPFSCQFEGWAPQYLPTLAFIFGEVWDSPYLVKFGNNIELTLQRLAINTMGMGNEEVAEIFRMMEGPGHYELVCHSNKETFPFAVRLFMRKTLLQFNFYAPLSDCEQLRTAIEMMGEHAESTREKVGVLGQMLEGGLKVEEALRIYSGM